MLYQASSPDELALVLGARDLGAKLLARSKEEMRIYNEADKMEESFRVCFEMPFTSDRKRMSVVVQQFGEYFVFTKGADSGMS